MKINEPYSRKTADYWHQIKVMTHKLSKFSVKDNIPTNEINETIKTLEKLSGNIPLFTVTHINDINNTYLH